MKERFGERIEDKQGCSLPLTNTQIRSFDSNVLRLPADKWKEYHGQADRLIVELSRSVRDKTGIRSTRAGKAGPFAKFIILHLG